MKRAILVLGVVAATFGCQAPPVVVIQRNDELPKLVGWRLVERRYGETDPGDRVGGDGEIPGYSKHLVYEPIYTEPRSRECGSVRVQSACEHEIRLRILGGMERSVGEPVTAECRIEGPEDVYHEIAIEATAAGMELLQIRGLSRGAVRPGHYLIRGNRTFEVIFTSRQAGRGTMGISVLRELREDPGPGPAVTTNVRSRRR